jgi:hypothetical protein
MHRKLGKIVSFDCPLPSAVRIVVISDLDVRSMQTNPISVFSHALYFVQLIRQVIADDPPKADYNINVFLGQGLVSSHGDVWRHDRR